MTIPYGLLGDGGMPQPNQMTGPGPASAPTPTNGPQPSLYQRLLANAPDALKRIQSSLLPVPAGLEGLIPQQDVDNARHQALLNLGLSMMRNSRGDFGHATPNFAQALSGGIQDAQGGFGKQLEGAMGAMTAGLSTAQQLRILQGRQQIGQQFPAKPNETPTETINRLRSMYAAYVAGGDTEMASKIGDVVGKLGEDPKVWMMQHYKEPIRVTNGANDDLYGANPWENPTTKIGSVPHNAPPTTPAEALRLSMEAQKNAVGTEQGLQKDFSEETKDYHNTALAYGNLNTLMGASKAGDPKAQLGVLEQYMKIINPGATIRPGVISVANAASGMTDRFIHTWNDITQHGAKGPAEMQFYYDNAKRLVDSQRAQYKNIENQTRARATRWGVDPSHVINDPFAGVPETSSTEPNTPGKVSIGKYLPKQP